MFIELEKSRDNHTTRLQRWEDLAIESRKGGDISQDKGRPKPLDYQTLNHHEGDDTTDTIITTTTTSSIHPRMTTSGKKKTIGVSVDRDERRVVTEER